MSMAKPSVKALARFIRSIWKTKRPKNRRNSTEASTLGPVISMNLNYLVELESDLLPSCLCLNYRIPDRFIVGRLVARVREILVKVVLLGYNSLLICPRHYSRIGASLHSHGRPFSNC